MSGLAGTPAGAPSCAIAGLMLAALAFGAPPAPAAPAPAPPPAATGAVEHLPLGSVKIPGRGRQVLFADLDGDGHDDPVIVYGEQSGCRLGRLVQRGHDLALEPLAPGEGAPVFAPQLGDLDADGTTDLLSADAEGILMRKGSGKGVFAPQARRLFSASDLLFTTDACEPAGPYLREGNTRRPAELVLPILGGARLLRVARAGAAPGPPQDLVTEPQIVGGEDGILFVSAGPVWIGAGASEIAIVGPLLERAAPRLDLSWWTRQQDGALQGHRTALALPPGENAALAYPFDLEADGTPEIALLTTPARIKSFFGEYGLRVYHATEHADVPAVPFYSGKTSINYWQIPAISFHGAAGGGDLLIAFYRGLLSAHLNVAIFSGDGKGSFEKSAHEVALASGKNAEREFLMWDDVNGDGTADIVTADDKGLRVHAGLADRSRPVASDPSWTSSLVPQIKGTSISISGDGAWSISFASEGVPIFHDLDADGLSEAIALGHALAGGDTLTIDRLKPRAK